jgi:hypothetical protein
MPALILFFPFRCCCEILLITKPVPLTHGSHFSFKNSAGVFLPSAPFPLGAHHTVDGRNESIEEFRSLQIDNSSTVFQFPNTKHFNLTYWSIPANLCPAPSYLLNADFHITSRTTFRSLTDLCFFVDPKGIGHLITVVVKSNRLLNIQFYVNNSNQPVYECVSKCPNCQLTCSSPFDQPFFLRITGAINDSLSLEIKYSIRYPSETRNGCFVSQIPSAMIAAEDSSVLQPQNYCVTLHQEMVRSTVKISALAVIALSIALLYQHLGYWDFRGWAAMPSAVECQDRIHGTMSIEFDLKGNGPVMPFIFQQESDSSSLTDPDDGLFVR